MEYVFVKIIVTLIGLIKINVLIASRLVIVRLVRDRESVCPVLVILCLIMPRGYANVWLVLMIQSIIKRTKQVY